MELEWLGFELHPSTPRGGREVAEMFGEAAVAGMTGRLKEAANRMGVSLDSVPSRLPNTRRALALVEQARAVGQTELHLARDAAMDAHWKHHKDLEDDAVLAEIAAIAGLDPATAVPAADHPRWQARVDAMRQEATSWGVSGIPTFFMLPDGWSLETAREWQGPSPVRVVGAQPMGVLRDAARRAGGQAR